MSSALRNQYNPGLRYSLYQRTPDGPYWVRFSIRGQGQVRKPLGTNSEHAAHQLAIEAWVDATGRAKQGLTAQNHRVKDVVESWLAQLQREADRGDRPQDHVRRYGGIASRYIAGFWGDRNIDSIQQRDIPKFWEWRYDYWTKGPGKDIKLLTYERAGRQIRRPISDSKRGKPSISSQRTEAVALKHFFKFAKNNGLIKDIPDIELVRARACARPSFDAEEFTRLEQKSLERLLQPGLNSSVRRDRLIIHCWIMVLTFTGMRPTEAKRLSWGDVLGYEASRTVPIGERDIRIRCWGKGRARRFLPLQAVIPWFDQLWDLFEREVKRTPGPRDPVFATPDGSRLGSVKNGLSELLKEVDLLTDYRGIRRTSYSFRHFHISQQLIAGAGVFQVAQNAGTGTPMIDKYYGHLTLEDMSKQLRPEWKKI